MGESERKPTRAHPLLTGVGSTAQERGHHGGTPAAQCFVILPARYTWGFRAQKMAPLRTNPVDQGSGPVSWVARFGRLDTAIG